MNRRIWIIGGTSEGRGLVKELAQLDIEIFVSVATTYGAKLIEQHSNVKVLPERMDLAAMQAFIAGHKPDCVIDATHPYATVVTQTVKEACAATGTEYLRLVRPAEAGYGSAVVVHDAAEAAEVLSHTEGKIFLTTGSKNLPETCLTLRRCRIMRNVLRCVSCRCRTRWRKRWSLVTSLPISSACRGRLKKI